MRFANLRATGWDETSSTGRAGDTELTRRDTEANFGCGPLLHRRSSPQLFFTRFEFASRCCCHYRQGFVMSSPHSIAATHKRSI